MTSAPDHPRPRRTRARRTDAVLPGLTVAAIQRAVARLHGITRADMLGHDRRRRYARPRQIAMHLARALTPRTYPELGRLFGNRDHTTIVHGDRVIGTLRLLDEDVAASIGIVERMLEKAHPRPAAEPAAPDLPTDACR